jgi:dissimilatory sulfite reductase (desulfoviridin) alpha/beta subunit
MSEAKTQSITVLVPAGRLPLDIMETANRLAKEHSFGIYLSTAQNLRLIDVPEAIADDVKNELAALGADFKAPGKFPIPRVCIGERHCKLGVIDTEALSNKILDQFKDKEKTKAKFKIAISGCTMCCSSAKTTDIGIMATRNGLDVFAGGKGGPFPKVGRRIAKGADENTVLEMVKVLVDFHDRKTDKKQRIFKLLEDSEFPYPEV